MMTTSNRQMSPVARYGSYSFAVTGRPYDGVNMACSLLSTSQSDLLCHMSLNASAAIAVGRCRATKMPGNAVVPRVNGRFFPVAGEGRQDGSEMQASCVGLRPGGIEQGAFRSVVSPPHLQNEPVLNCRLFRSQQRASGGDACPSCGHCWPPPAKHGAVPGFPKCSYCWASAASLTLDGSRIMTRGLASKWHVGLDSRCTTVAGMAAQSGASVLLPHSSFPGSHAPAAPYASVVTCSDRNVMSQHGAWAMTRGRCAGSMALATPPTTSDAMTQTMTETSTQTGEDGWSGVRDGLPMGWQSGDGGAAASAWRIPGAFLVRHVPACALEDPTKEHTQGNDAHRGEVPDSLAARGDAGARAAGRGRGGAEHRQGKLRYHGIGYDQGGSTRAATQAHGARPAPRRQGGAIRYTYRHGQGLPAHERAPDRGRMDQCMPGQHAAVPEGGDTGGGSQRSAATQVSNIDAIDIASGPSASVRACWGQQGAAAMAAAAPSVASMPHFPVPMGGEASEDGRGNRGDAANRDGAGDGSDNTSGGTVHGRNPVASMVEALGADSAKGTVAPVWGGVAAGLCSGAWGGARLLLGPEEVPPNNSAREPACTALGDGEPLGGDEPLGDDELGANSQLFGGADLLNDFFSISISLDDDDDDIFQLSDISRASSAAERGQASAARRTRVGLSPAPPSAGSERPGASCLMSTGAGAADAARAWDAQAGGGRMSSMVAVAAATGHDASDGTRAPQTYPVPPSAACAATHAPFRFPSSSEQAAAQPAGAHRARGDPSAATAVVTEPWEQPAGTHLARDGARADQAQLRGTSPAGTAPVTAAGLVPPVSQSAVSSPGGLLSPLSCGADDLLGEDDDGGGGAPGFPHDFLVVPVSKEERRAVLRRHRIIQQELGAAQREWYRSVRPLLPSPVSEEQARLLSGSTASPRGQPPWGEELGEEQQGAEGGHYADMGVSPSSLSSPLSPPSPSSLSSLASSVESLVELERIIEVQHRQLVEKGILPKELGESGGVGYHHMRMALEEFHRLTDMSLSSALSSI